MLEARSGYYQNTVIFFSNFSYGVSKNLSLDVGFSTLPGLDLENQFFSIGAKTGTTLNENFDVSASTKYYRFFDADAGITTVFGSITYSKKRLDLTTGSGVGFSNGESSNLLFILGAQYRISQRIAFLTENFILPSGDSESIPIISIGGRFISTKSAFDLGFFVPDDSQILIPFASYTIKF